MGGSILARNLFAALLSVFDLADIATTLKDHKRLRDLAFRGEGYSFAKLRITLPPDGVETRDKHSRLLHLMDRLSRFDGVMLALVADEDDPLDASLGCLVEETIDLSRREQARFVNDPDLFRLSLR